MVSAKTYSNICDVPTPALQLKFARIMANRLANIVISERGISTAASPSIFDLEACNAEIDFLLADSAFDDLPDVELDSFDSRDSSLINGIGNVLPIPDGDLQRREVLLSDPLSSDTLKASRDVKDAAFHLIGDIQPYIERHSLPPKDPRRENLDRFLRVDNTPCDQHRNSFNPLSMPR